MDKNLYPMKSAPSKSTTEVTLALVLLGSNAMAVPNCSKAAAC